MGIILALVALTILTAAPSLDAAQVATEKPNLIFILGDDIAQGGLGCYGQKRIKSRIWIVWLLKARYTQAYAGTSVCASSRASLMTGLHILPVLRLHVAAWLFLYRIAPPEVL